MDEPLLVDIFCVYETLSEYAVADKPMAFASDKVTAERYGIGKGWCGGPCVVKPVKALVVGFAVYPLLVGHSVEVITADDYARKAALAKLSPEDRKVLGL